MKLMRETHQESPGIYPLEIQMYGCYFLSLLRLVEIEKRMNFCTEDVNKLYKKYIKKNFMNTNCYIVKPSKILFDHGISRSVFKTDKNYLTWRTEHEISEVRIEGLKNSHFLVSRDKKIIWDSLFLTERNKKFELISKRIFRKIEEAK